MLNTKNEPRIESSDYDVNQPVHRRRIEDYAPEIGDFGPFNDSRRSNEVPDHRSGRRLLPRNCHYNPDCGKNRSKRNHQGREKVHPGGNPVPGKDQYGQESRFQEKGENAFRGQRGAENISYIPGVCRPVCSELEFHDDSGSDSQRKIEREDFRPELSGRLKLRILGLEIPGLQKYQQRADSNSKRREQVMEHDCEGKLYSRKRYDVHRIYPMSMLLDGKFRNVMYPDCSN